MDYFPIFVKLTGQSCLVVGAGDIAARKIDLLLRAGAQITVIAQEIGTAVAALQAQQAITVLKKAFDVEDVHDYRLVVSATDDLATNQLVAQTAHERHILVNVVDNPQLCSFIFPAIIDRSPIVAAISSGGVAPVLARLLRAKMETVISPAYGQLAALAERFRNPVKQQIKQPQQRRVFWERVFQGSVAELVFAGNQKAAESQLQKLLADNQDSTPCGEVYLIGAGPGAADLLTFRALRLMQQADVVVYDRLVSLEILDLARRDSEKIYVGKQRQNHALPQESINELLANLARQGKRVARVKGGDPFIFGRGGEEIETLMQQGIHFQVVPGITAASGCASYAGIPLTHRDHAQSCTFVTGHLKDDSVNLNWTQLAAPNQTVVIYMGSVGLDKICQALMAHGSPEDLPIALIQQGTTINQKVITGTLATISALIANQHIKAPTLIIIGTVVTLHNQLAWFSSGQSVQND
ncbi:Siroheme synthase (Includes: Uroporphyrinogen-III C-methyltransferase; Precorrin-2 dehydrogenase; Sirohydrochlorin ferrochelatase) [Crenothrix polyspora]|uniref:Siroheme synthase n=1 Tax=Crenothrix polyspora TaxID=360316 RepID=A0A1R4H364_9GAMM|nr:siroheme synthase CysG [Crenothrix polyspora]SJM90698.1 Siroheme synthase (Includes: Uroporphyrinogen-III C-methyltransferase; Precorrin-2 dehydrogenase; Sirohydrochlorin ferrochelatase) [Crenothrix polyspora]